MLALGIAAKEVTQDELAAGTDLPKPKFNTAAVAYVLAADVKKGDAVEIALVKDGKALMHNTETLAKDEAKLLLQAGKRGVPAGGWPDGSYAANLKITRDGKTIVEQTSEAMPFE
ncbi:MAG TPA: hypothetical protein VEX16_05265 [Methyloceanibacter sp.]|nr:hypothetical protein [Methyloceanibacter sp.]